jgi:uncharacterized membrane protein YdbT with pleckstrin-like domain
VDFPSRLLNEGEQVVIHTRTHPKVLLLPVVALVLVIAAAVVLGGLVGPGSAGDVVRIVAWVVAGVVILWFVVRPVVGWLTTTYTFTDRRFVKRAGFIAKEGRTIPLNRISGVDFEIGVVDRLFGCGTLVVADASEDGQVRLHDIPRVEDVQKQVAAELDRLSRRRSADDGA